MNPQIFRVWLAVLFFAHEGTKYTKNTKGVFKLNPLCVLCALCAFVRKKEPLAKYAVMRIAKATGLTRKQVESL